MTGPFGVFSHDQVPGEVQRARLIAEAMRRGIEIPAPLRAQLYQEEAARRGLLVYHSFFEYVLARNPALLEHEYMRRLVALAQRVIDGQLRRLMILLPTQYGKSEVFSRLLPAYYLLRYPSRKIMLGSFDAALAWEHAGAAKDYYAASGGQFRIGSKGADRNWKTIRATGGAQGGMYSTGIAGSFLGRGFHLGVVDDPVNPMQASRGKFQRRFQDWWPAQFLRAQQPRALGGNSILFVMQRLDIMDPAAWLLEREQTDAKMHWHIVALDEIHTNEPFERYKGPMGFPESCSLEPDWRAPGEVLAPRFRAPDEVNELQRTASPLVRAAQRQQRPMRPEGDFWKKKWFVNFYDELPSDAHNGGWDWDTAYTKDEHNSGTASVKTFRGKGSDREFRIYVDDFRLEYLEFPQLVAFMRQFDPPHYIEAKASGKSSVQVLKSEGIMAEEVTVKGDKMARASAAQPSASMGRIYIRRAIAERFLEGDQGLLRITADALMEDGEGLDLNDAFVQSVWRHLNLAAVGFRAAWR